jgi:sugar phosphate permease
VDRRDIARATSVLNVTQRIGGAVGTALFAVVLQQNLQQAAGGTPQDVAEAFGATFWWPLLITAAVFLPALLMPKGKPAQHGPPQQPQSQDRAPETASARNE